ncbi:cytidine deaminase family protein [Streptococcus minor]|uniref:cytidine deaminase family protein n=1 Tax=Streptococcus minor TaxID=229549 RepID=UPI0021AB3DF9|nr:cytidine deaminase [Streptococcus minor]
MSAFVYANHVVAAIEAEDGQIFTGFCFEATADVFHLCAERAAAFNMYQESDQTRIRRNGDGSGMPCGACREFLIQLNSENTKTEFLQDYESRTSVTLGELMPYW